MKHICRTHDETKIFAQNLLNFLRSVESEGATILALSGNLGSGKTELTKKIAQLLGVEKPIVSPTFMLRNDYTTNDTTFRELHHIDAYRLDDGDEKDTIGLNELLKKPNTLIVIEWAEKFSTPLPPHTVRIIAEVSDTIHTFTSDDI